MSHKTNDLSKLNSIFKAKEVRFQRFFRERSDCKTSQIDFIDFLNIFLNKFDKNEQVFHEQFMLEFHFRADRF